MERVEYIEKMENMLSNGKLDKDPTATIEAKVTRALIHCEKSSHMTTNDRLRLQPQCSSPSQLYGLPKIHKKDVYRLAKFLADILTLFG